MGTRARGVVAVVAAGAVLMAGCTVEGSGEPAVNDIITSDVAPEEFAEQVLDWGTCDSGASGTECATYEVPLDYDDPDGERVEIAVKRFPASGDDPIGSLLVNPGGPGGSGYDFADAAPFIIGDQVREHFDVVGFDPRGVGRSTPLTCLDSEGIDDLLGAQIDGDGDTDAGASTTEESIEELEETGRAFVEACKDNAPELMLHVGTANVARDMDLLRGLLGDEELTYLGASYGTHIGAQYAEQFPDRVRALVLDGAVDPDQEALEASVAQATGFETALHAFVEDCLASVECPLGGSGDTVEDGLEVLTTFLEGAADEPLDNSMDDREVNRARAELGVLAALYSKEWWPQVREGLADGMEDGDGTVLMQLADDLYDRADLDAYENSTAMLTAVNCSDAPSPRDTQAYADAAERAAEESPIFGPMLAWSSLTCAFWPEEAVAEGSALTAEGADPIMVVGTTRDSATPYEWSEALADQLESGFLVTRDGDGHTGYQMGDACVDRIVDEYLVDLTVPEDGGACA